MAVSISRMGGPPPFIALAKTLLQQTISIHSVLFMTVHKNTSSSVGPDTDHKRTRREQLWQMESHSVFFNTIATNII